MPQKVRAKFRLVECVTKESGDKDNPIVFDLKFVVVGADTPENKMFWKWTPSGTIHLCSINKQAVDMFNIRQEYYVDFTPVEIDDVETSMR